MLVMLGAIAGVAGFAAWRPATVAAPGEVRFSITLPDDEKLAVVLERLAELEPDSRSIRKKLAELALAGKDFAAARKWATALIHLDLHDADAHAQLAAAAGGMEDWALAAEEYETAVALGDGKPEWKMAWAQSLLAAGKRNEARRATEHKASSPPMVPLPPGAAPAAAMTRPVPSLDGYDQLLTSPTPIGSTTIEEATA